MVNSYIKIIDKIAYPLIELLTGLHDCHICKYPLSQISGKGKKRTICTKYNSSIKRIRDNCIDRFSGFTIDDMNKIAKQYKVGKIKLVINNVDV